MFTTAQLGTLKTAILGNSTWAAFPNTGDGNYNLAALLNQPASPTVAAWKKIMTSDVVAAIQPAEVDNMYSTSKGYAFDFLLRWMNGIDCTASQGPKAITDICTQSAAPNTRAALLAVATENMTAGQQIFGGTVVASATPPTAISATIRNYAGQFTGADIAAAYAGHY